MNSALDSTPECNCSPDPETEMQCVMNRRTGCGFGRWTLTDAYPPFIPMATSGCRGASGVVVSGRFPAS